MHDADAERAILRRHAVDGDDLARHFADRRTARGQRGAGMARLADGFEIEARDRVTPGDDAVIGPARLGHQHVFVASGLGLDDVAGRRRADFLVRREQHRDRQRRGEGGAGQLPDRFQRQVIAALHVEDAGAEAFVALAPPRAASPACRRDERYRDDRRSGCPVRPASDAESGRGRSRQNPAGRRCARWSHP